MFRNLSKCFPLFLLLFFDSLAATESFSNVFCGKMLDTQTGLVQSNVMISIDHDSGKIRSVRFNEVSANPNNLDTLDLSNYFCLPGLIDMHTHISEGTSRTLVEYLTMTQQDQLVIGRVNVQKTLLAGFTSVRDLGVYIAWTDKALRDEINSGLTNGPRMQISGFYLTIPGGGGDIDIPGYSGNVPAHIRQGVTQGIENFRLRAEAAVAGGADLLKMIASGAVLAFGSIPGSPEMTPDEIAVVVTVGHNAGMKVTAHAHGAQSIKDAILAGVDSIEHASLIDDEGIRLARDNGVALSMDIYNGDYINTVGKEENWPEEFLRKNRETTDEQRSGFTKAHQAGVRIVYGTDAGVYPHGDNAKQFSYMVKQGMTSVEAIQAATIHAADVMGWGNQVGRINPGFFADIVALRDNPISNIQALEKIDVVIKGGQLYKLEGKLFN
jgi:imidazolonepropionase-like amidohydrolase|tara:strand:+ start:1266 stop:2582 length:1317 start_codon:yes stop_codon:yes gene_type:complete